MTAAFFDKHDHTSCLVALDINHVSFDLSLQGLRALPFRLSYLLSFQLSEGNAECNGDSGRRQGTH
jgi:hypothetical protein